MIANRTLRDRTLSITTLAVALLLGGCATEPTPTETHFGDSVRGMIRAQTYDQSTLSAPPTAAVERTDGQMLEGALESYRNTSAEPAAAGNEVTISVGGGE